MATLATSLPPSLATDRKNVLPWPGNTRVGHTARLHSANYQLANYMIFVSNWTHPPNCQITKFLHKLLNLEASLHKILYLDNLGGLQFNKSHLTFCTLQTAQCNCLVHSTNCIVHFTHLSVLNKMHKAFYTLHFESWDGVWKSRGCIVVNRVPREVPRPKPEGP